MISEVVEVPPADALPSEANGKRSVFSETDSSSPSSEAPAMVSSSLDLAKEYVDDALHCRNVNFVPQDHELRMYRLYKNKVGKQKWLISRVFRGLVMPDRTDSILLIL